MFRFDKTYFLIAVAILFVEILIALHIHDAFIRPYVGDFLVVILLYTLLRSVIKTAVLPAAIFVLLFAFAVETAQCFNWVEHLGLGNNKLARIVMGNSFEWSDLLAYTAGIITVLVLERRKALA